MRSVFLNMKHILSLYCYKLVGEVEVMVFSHAATVQMYIFHYAAVFRQYSFQQECFEKLHI